MDSLYSIDAKTCSTFVYLSPAEYKLKVIYDYNENGKWDPGNYLKNKLPEKVQYYKSTIKLRENWEHVENWDLTSDP